LAHERLAVGKRAQSLISGLLAVSSCGSAVGGSHHALLGVDRVVLCRCEIASAGGPIARTGSDIAILRDPVALGSGVQTRLGGLLTLAGRARPVRPLSGPIT
jgi:hypothetical protein